MEKYYRLEDIAKTVCEEMDLRTEEWDEVAEAIERVPAADVEPVRHEMWEGYSTSRFYGFDKSSDPIYRDGDVYYCSNPRCRRKTIIKGKYCPNCGAKMDGWRRLY